MGTQLDMITHSLRERILAGEYEPGEKLAEVTLARALEVSRTPVRLAMAALEQEGLLVREPNRGFRVRGFTIDEVADAIEVRGELEAMAGRLAAEKGLPGADAVVMERCLAKSERLLEVGLQGIEERLAWIDINVAFHRALVSAARNRALTDAIDHVSRIPLAGPRAIVFDSAAMEKTLRQAGASHEDHGAIHDAIRRGHGLRVAGLIREHAYRSARNKRDNFAAMKAERLGVALPGFGLVQGRSS